MKRQEKLQDEDYSAIIAGINNMSTAAADYVDHVNGQAHPSRTQKNRLKIVKALSVVLETARTLTQTNTDKMEIQEKPEEVLFRKLHSRQYMISESLDNDENFRKQVAGMIYMTGLSQNVVSLTKENKLTNALLQHSYNKNRDQIMNDPAFRKMMQETEPEELLRMAMKGNGEELLRAYTRQRAIRKNDPNTILQHENGNAVMYDGNYVKQNNNQVVNQQELNLPGNARDSIRTKNVNSASE